MSTGGFPDFSFGIGTHGDLEWDDNYQTVLGCVGYYITNGREIDFESNGDIVHDVTYNLIDNTFTHNGTILSTNGKPNIFAAGPDIEYDMIEIFGYPNGTKVYEASIYDPQGNLISHMIPHEENGQKGLYCTVRNLFLPVQSW